MKRCCRFYDMVRLQGFITKTTVDEKGNVYLHLENLQRQILWVDCDPQLSQALSEANMIDKLEGLSVDLPLTMKFKNGAIVPVLCLPVLGQLVARGQWFPPKEQKNKKQPSLF